MQNTALTDNVMDAIANELSALESLSAANDVSADPEEKGGYVSAYKISYRIS